MSFLSYLHNLNNNPKTSQAPIATYISIVGDLLRLLCLFFLGTFIFKNKPSSFKHFLLTYAISSIMIGYFAYHQGHTLRGISEYILAVVFGFFYMKY
jgi:hypothetical protein